MHPNIKENLKDNLQNARENLQNAKDSVRQNLQNAKDNLQNAREDVLAARKCENINDPVDTHFVDYVGMAFSKLFIKLHIIPNVVTSFALISGVAGGILFALNRGLWMDVLAAVLVFLSAVFDASDGQVARLTKHYSQLGRMLDGFSDASGYFTLYLACVLRLWNRPFLGADHLPHWLLIAAGLLAFVLYVIQSQLPDYFKNLHMYMIDNSHGNELARCKHILSELKQAPRGSFTRFAKLCYYCYTWPQEHRAPKTQQMLDAIEKKGKNDALCDGFYAVSRKLVKLTNLLTFNLRTFVLLICMFLHLEWVALLFVLLVLEPIRVILLLRYEKLSESLLPLV